MRSLLFRILNNGMRYLAEAIAGVDVAAMEMVDDPYERVGRGFRGAGAGIGLAAGGAASAARVGGAAARRARAATPRGG